MSKSKILLVEDDPNFGSVLKDYLELHDFEVRLAHDGEAGWKSFSQWSPDLAILDVMMPKLDGFSLAERIRAKEKDQPLIFLTAKSLKEDVLKGYKLGADDYLTKPFDSEVLLYKIRAVIARNERAQEQPEEQDVYQIGDYVFEPKLRNLSRGKHAVRLSPKEAELLKLLCVYTNDLMPRKLALLKIWKEENYFTGRSMDVYIAKLRKYLAEDPRVEIVNIHSEGFRLVCPVEVNR